MVTINVADVVHYKKGAAKEQVPTVPQPKETIPMPTDETRSILTATYEKTTARPRRVRATVNVKTDMAPISLTFSVHDLPTGTDNYYHAITAWKLARKLGWVGGVEAESDQDLISTPIERLPMDSVGKSWTLWTLNSKCKTAKEIIFK